MLKIPINAEGILEAAVVTPKNLMNGI